MWDVIHNEFQEEREMKRGKRKGNMNTRYKILNMHTCMAGSKKLEAFVFACM